MLEVRKSGNKTLYYRYNQDGKTIMYKLSDAQFMDIDDARRHALKMKKAIAAGGLETLFAKKSKTMTLNEFYNEIYLPHIMVHNRKSYVCDVSSFKNHILPIFGRSNMNEITPNEISKAHIEMKTVKKLSNGTANKLLIFMRHAYKMAIDMKIAGITDNPASKVKKLEELNREKYITKGDVVRLMRTARESKNTMVKYIIPFLLLTGARRTEVLRAQYAHLNNESLMAVA